MEISVTSPQLALGLLVILSAIFLTRRVISKPLGPSPPGPKPRPIIGNLLDVPLAYPWRTYSRWTRSWGGLSNIGYVCRVLTPWLYRGYRFHQGVRPTDCHSGLSRSRYGSFGEAKRCSFQSSRFIRGGPAHGLEQNPSVIPVQSALPKYAQDNSALPRRTGTDRKNEWTS